MAQRLSALLLLGVALTATSALAGNTVRAEPRKAVAAAPKSVKRVAAKPKCPIPRTFLATYKYAAHENNIPLPMLYAVTWVESRFDPDAHSGAGARGLMQVLPSTGAELDLDVEKPGENVVAGARYLRQMLDRFRSTELALAAYNAGPSAVDAEGVRTSDETVTYVARVTEEWRRLLGCA